MTTIFCAVANNAITAVFGTDISQYDWITVPSGYTSMPSTDARYSTWYEALPDSMQALAVAPGD